MIALPDAVKEQIRRTKRPVITWFEIEEIVRCLYRERTFDGQRLLIKGRFPSPHALAALKTELTSPNSTIENDRSSLAWEDWIASHGNRTSAVAHP